LEKRGRIGRKRSFLIVQLITSGEVPVIVATFCGCNRLVINTK
jgi:hypothetical protein